MAGLSLGDDGAAIEAGADRCRNVQGEGHVNTLGPGCADGWAIVEARIMATPLRSIPPAPADARRDLPDVRPVEGAEADEELAALAKALGHPARVQIMRLLVRREACICGDIVDELPLAQSTVSQHLKVLKEAGLVRGDIDGPRVCYCVEPRALRRLKALVGSL
jgi:ArsR family transcriptional regulator